MPLSAGSLVAYLSLNSAEFEAGIRRSREQMAAAGGSAERLGVSVTQAEAALRGAGQEAAAGAAGTAKFRQAQLQALAAAERYTKVLGDESATLAQVARAEAGLIAANERLKMSAPTAAIVRSNAEVAKTPGLMARTSAGMAGAAKSMLGLGAAFGAFELFKHAFAITKEANDFHRAMVQTQTTANVSASEINKASGALLAMAGSVAAAPNDLATAWYHAKSVGLDYAQSIDVTRVAAEGAKVGHADLEQTMNALTSTVASGIPGVKNMGSAMGQLIAIVGSGDMKLSDLNSALGSGILTVVKGYGLSLTDVGAALATFGDNNIRGANAATMLRLAVQAMAVPAKAGSKLLGELGLTSEGSAAALAKVHLTTGTLAKDMQTGGLNKAITDLRTHLKAAGVTGVQTGQVLTEMFGKKAGPGIAVLLGQYDRLQSKFKILRDSGSGFDAKWKATTQTASFVLSSLGHQAEAAGIQFASHLGPAIASTAGIIGRLLPAAVGVVVAAAQPFLAVFHALADVLGPVAHAAMATGSSLSPVGPILKDVAAGALAAYAAMKLLAVGQAVFVGISDGLAVLRLRAVNAAIGLQTMAANAKAVATGQRAMSLGAFSAGLAAVAVGGYAAGRALSGLVEKNNAMAHTLDNLGSVEKNFASALDATNGKLDDNVRRTVAAQLQSSGLADRAAKAGVSLKQLTDGVTGGSAALAKMAGVLRAHGASDDTLVALGLIGATYGKTAKNAAILGTVTATKVTPALKAAAAATTAHANALGVSSTAYAAAEKAAKANTDQTTAQTLAFQLENDAASLLQNALKGLAGINLDVATATTGLSSANLSVAASFKQNGSAIDGASAKAVANQQAIQGQVQAAQQYAEAIGKQTGSSKAAVAALNSSKNALEAQLRAQGKLTPAVQAYIEKLYNIKNLKVPPTKLDVDKAAADAKIKTLQDRINAIRQGKVPGLDANSAPARGVIANLQAQIYRLQHPGAITIDANVNLAISAMQRVQSAIDKLTGGHIDIGVSGRGTAGMATGGIVNGPGTGTSDTAGVFALSKGEAVIPAKAVSRHPALIRSLITAGRGLASGGVVGSLASFLASLGLSKAGIAGVLGNAQIESSMNLGAYNAKENAHGLFQWEGGRWTALQALAKRLGVGATSKTAEFAMLKRELSSMPGLLKTLRSTGSASGAAAAFDAIFERSSGSSRGARESAASSFMSQLASGHLTGAAGNGLSQSTGTSGAFAAANALGKLIHGGRDHTKGVGASDVIADMVKLESALAKSGASSGLINKLTRENKELSDAAAKRNHAASMLVNAQKAVANALNTRTQDTATFKAAGVGSFDITSAGADANGNVSAGSLRASQQQAVTKVRKWASDMGRLSKLKIFPAAYLRALLGKGPDALPTVEALLQMSGSDMKAFASNERTIDSLSGSVATAGAKALDDPAIIAAQKSAAAWNKQVAKYQHAIEHVVENGLKGVAAEISRLNVSSRLEYRAGDLYVAVKTDESRSAHRKATK